jgi:hypothetical protein
MNVCVSICFLGLTNKQIYNLNDNIDEEKYVKYAWI